MMRLLALMLLLEVSLMADPYDLSPCPNSPNCVSSLADPSDAHYVAPLDVYSENGPIWLLAALLEEWKGIKLVEVDDIYLHATCTSSWFRFVDDLELLYVPEESLIHVRSASRTGYWDLGANRRRIERIREQWDGQH